MAGGDTVYGVTISEDGKTITLGYLYAQPVYSLTAVSVSSNSDSSDDESNEGGGNNDEG